VAFALVAIGSFPLPSALPLWPAVTMTGAIGALAAWAAVGGAWRVFFVQQRIVLGGIVALIGVAAFQVIVPNSRNFWLLLMAAGAGALTARALAVLERAGGRPSPERVEADQRLHAYGWPLVFLCAVIGAVRYFSLLTGR